MSADSTAQPVQLFQLYDVKNRKTKIDVQSLWKHQISLSEARRAEGWVNIDELSFCISWWFILCEFRGPPAAVRSASLDVHLQSDDFSINWCLLGAIFTLAHNQHNRRERSTALTFPVDPLLQWTIILVISCSVGNANSMGFHHDAIFSFKTHLECIKILKGAKKIPPKKILRNFWICRYLSLSIY